VPTSDFDFMQVSKKKHSNHTWRDILEGRKALSMGLICRIGDRTTTNVWNDRWIPNHFDGKPITTPASVQIEMVSDLLTPSGGWN
jgi:hypothetical protein